MTLLANYNQAFLFRLLLLYHSLDLDFTHKVYNRPQNLDKRLSSPYNKVEGKMTNIGNKYAKGKRQV